MKIIISGSTGIIGRQLLKNIIEKYSEKVEIFIITRNEIIGKDFKVSFDILNFSEQYAEKIFKIINPTLFFHFAWDTNHLNYLKSEDNITWEKCSIRLINAFYNSGGFKFIGIGSSIEYDWSKQSPYSENSPLNGNSWKYGESKMNIYNYLSQLNGINYQWDRVFFVFGPGQGKTRLIPLIINSALNKEPKILNVNINLKRDYISTFEIAKQILMMSETEFSGSINICSGNTIELGELVNHISNITSRKLHLSENTFKDNFEVNEIGGKIDIIKRYFPDYEYTSQNLINDLTKTIESYKL